MGFSSHVWPEGSPAKLSTVPRLCSEVSECPAKLRRPGHVASFLSRSDPVWMLELLGCWPICQLSGVFLACPRLPCLPCLPCLLSSLQTLWQDVVNPVLIVDEWAHPQEVIRQRNARFTIYNPVHYPKKKCLRWTTIYITSISGSFQVVKPKNGRSLGRSHPKKKSKKHDKN